MKKKVNNKIFIYVLIFIIIILVIFYFKNKRVNNIGDLDQVISDSVFYVAQNEKGANNDNNGLYPTFKGGNNGPFKDLNFDKIKLPSKPFKILLRSGYYKVPSNGLHIYESGNEDNYIVLSNYKDEKVIIDGNGNDIAIKLDGNYVILENLEIKNSKIYNLQIKSSNVIIRNNKLHDSYEDGIKVLSSASDILIENNEIYDFNKEGIDVFGSKIKINSNYMHDGKNSNLHNENHCFLAKGGAEDVLFSNNICKNLESDWGGSIILGGVTGTKYNKIINGNVMPQGTRIKAINNTISNIKGGAVSFIECIDCEFSNNKVIDVTWGIKFVSGSNYDTQDVVVKNNNFKIVKNGFIALIEMPTQFREFDYNLYDSDNIEYILSEKSKYKEDLEVTEQINGNNRREVSLNEIKNKGLEVNSIYK